MNTKKLNFSAIKNTLSRSEMKKIMAGSGGGCGPDCSGCQNAEGGSGCIKWECKYNSICAPVWSSCCWV